MAMEITNNYGNYVSGYTNNISDSKSDEMTYLRSLQKKYGGTAFAVGTVSKGQTYGNSSVTNFVINPDFISKLDSDSKNKSALKKM